MARHGRGGGIVGLAVALVALSVVLYAALYLTLGRVGDIVFYTFLDIAFIPVQVLLVGLVINRLLALREREALLHKLNMVIGVFYSEVGRPLMALLAGFDAEVARTRPFMLVRQTWTDRDFDDAIAGVTGSHTGVDIRTGDTDALKAYLTDKRRFLLGLLENPNLLEHDRFTDVLWTVTHLAEELAFRPSLRGLPEADLAHLTLDTRRAYTALLAEWLEHMRHLKHDYPYLFSFAVRTNPFDPDADVEITG